jgi:hypothetical protein
MAKNIHGIVDLKSACCGLAWPFPQGSMDVIPRGNLHNKKGKKGVEK